MNRPFTSHSLILALCLTLIYGGQGKAQNILPPRPEAIGGGNPFEGLGRPDDPNPSRIEEVNNPGKENVVTGSEGPPPGPDGVVVDDAEKQAKEEKEKAQERKSLIKPGLMAQRSAGLASMPEPAARLALQELHSGRYEEALGHLKTLSRIHPQAPEVDYLMGVACVMTLRFDHAKAHYLKVLSSNAPPDLKEMARKGLTKLGHSGVVE